MILYDVCSDYSLCDKVSVESVKDAESDVYKWKKAKYQGYSVLLGWHDKHDELHYLKAPDEADLAGEYIIWD